MLNTTQIWNLKTYKIHTDLPGHTDEVYCVDFVADKIVSAGRDATVKMYVLEFLLGVTLTLLTPMVVDGRIKRCLYTSFVLFDLPVMYGTAVLE